MVNGIVASPFAVNHMLANMFYSVHRLLYAVSPGILGMASVRRLNEVSLIWLGLADISANYVCVYVDTHMCR